MVNYKAVIIVTYDKKYRVECELPFVPQVGMLFSDTSHSIDMLRVVEVGWNNTEKRFYVYLGLGLLWKPGRCLLCTHLPFPKVSI